LTKRYRALGEYPEGTLGRAYFDYMIRNGFFFPGEKGSPPEIIAVHDCLHVLGDYGTTPSEEIEISAFQAGCQSEDPIFGLLFGLAQYHLGVQVAPVAAAEKMHADPQLMIAAFVRGCQVNRDMWRDFQPWDFFPKSLNDVRTELGIPARQK
jgi:ubiquinone biosynthesis protein Coq4